MRKSKNNQMYKKRLWRVFSEYIWKRDNYTCISCGKKCVPRSGDYQAGHYLPRTRGLATFFDEQNVNCQCVRCNQYMHGNIQAYALALQRKYGDDILKKLEWKSRQLTQISEPLYLKLIQEYKDKIKKLDETNN